MSFQQSLFGLNKDGSFKVWTISALHTSIGDGVIVIEHGKEFGKKTRKEEVVTEGKQGRNAYEQAIFQAKARVKKQLDKGYRETKEELSDIPLIAMLAHDYLKNASHIDYDDGVYISDKLDGVRCLAKCIFDKESNSKVVTIESRTGQPWNVPHITAELELVMNIGDILDGELYVHGPSLQEITSAVKRVDASEYLDECYVKLCKAYEKFFGKDDKRYHDALDKYNEAEVIADIRQRLEFRIFDMVSDKPFVERFTDLYELEQYISNNTDHPLDHITFVRYKLVFNEEDMKDLHADAVIRGYEGIMLRNPKGVYESGKRSYDLQKYKVFMDSEFEIVDVVPDKEGYAVFVIKNDLNDNLFNCVMGSMQEREAYLLNKESIKGKFLKVKFQARYKDTLLPQFGTGLMIRDGHLSENGDFVAWE